MSCPVDWQINLKTQEKKSKDDLIRILFIWMELHEEFAEEISQTNVSLEYQMFNEITCIKEIKEYADSIPISKLIRLDQNDKKKG